MAQPFVTLPAGVMSAGGPATAFVTTNTKVKTQAGAIGLATDVLQFSGPMAVGMWTMTNSRVSVNHIPTVSTTGIGTATGPSPPYSAPVSVTLGDPRASGS